MTEIRIVRWTDSALQNGQVDSSEFPRPCVITSVGFVVGETEEYLVLARDDMGGDGDRGLLAIPTSVVEPWLAASQAVDIQARDLRKGDDLFGAGEVASAVWVGGSVQVRAGGTTFTFWPDEEVTVRREDFSGREGSDGRAEN